MPSLSHNLSVSCLLRPGAPDETSVGIPEVQLAVVVIPLAPVNPDISSRPGVTATTDMAVLLSEL